MADGLRVLALEPYFGGSHRAFLEGWQRHSRHSFTILGLPASKWKWRMRQSSLLFAWDIQRRARNGETWDVVFCSDMLNAAELRGLCRHELGGIAVVQYFHENQLTYPVRFSQERDMHFGVTNIVSAVAADEVWFNSAFHRESFLEAIPGFLAKMPDHRPLAALEQVRERARVLYPGIDPPTEVSQRKQGALHILWTARWEHDKNPEGFFAALELLRERDVAFHLSVLGQSFRERPAVFEEARVKFADRILHWGYLEQRSDFEAVLAEADVWVSTAEHEFFGLAAVEAMAAGAHPVLPLRLSYPEVVGLEQEPTRRRFFYDGSTEGLAERLEELSSRKQRGEQHDPGAVAELAHRFHWRVAAGELDSALDRVAGEAASD